DAFRARVLQPGGETGIAMVKAFVEAELALDVVAFVLAAGKPDGACALDPGDLADGLAYRARRRSDNDGLARLRLADLEQACIGGHAGHAEHTHRSRDWRNPGIDLGEPLAI